MRPRPVTAYLMACAAAIASLLIYMQYIYLLGFPDGFISELGHAERRLAYFAIGVSLLFGSFFLYLGRQAPQARTNQRLYIAIVLYLLALVSIALVGYSYRITLIDAAGG